MGVPGIKTVKATTYYSLQSGSGLVNVPVTSYLTPSTTRTRAAHARKFRQFSSSTDSFKFSSVPRTVPLWNYLPASLASNSFRKDLFTLSFFKQSGSYMLLGHKGPGSKEGSLVFTWWANSFWEPKASRNTFSFLSTSLKIMLNFISFIIFICVYSHFLPFYVFYISIFFILPIFSLFSSPLALPPEVKPTE